MFKIKITDKVFLIHNIYEYARDYCKDYLTFEKPDIEITITLDDINYERIKSEKEAELEGIEAQSFSDSYLETLALYRKIVESLLDYDIMLVHGSLISVDGIGYLFTGKSGIGKSTHSALWQKVFGLRVLIINDDKPLIKVTKEGIIAYGTPWSGKHKLDNNISVPLKNICFINRGINNKIEILDKKQAFLDFLNQVYKPNDKKLLIKTLKLADNLVKQVNFYKLYCNKEEEAVQVAYNGMNEK